MIIAIVLNITIIIVLVFCLYWLLKSFNRNTKGKNIYHQDYEIEKNIDDRHDYKKLNSELEKAEITIQDQITEVECPQGKAILSLHKNAISQTKNLMEMRDNLNPED